MTAKFYKTTLALGGLLLGSGLTAMGQDAAPAAGAVTEKDLLMMLLFTTVVVALVCLLLTLAILALVRARMAEQAAPAGEAATAEGALAGAAAGTATAKPGQAEPSAWSWAWIQGKLTNAVPVENEDQIDLGHDYDGIRELDNSLPPWWKYGFYFTIGWAVVYFMVFHVFGDWSSDQEYREEMAAADIAKQEYLKTAANQVDESNVVVLEEAEALASGQAIYESNCAACHGLAGEGGIGPTFADQYWIHGGGVSDVFKIIKYGVPAKGMISWQDQLRPREMQEVASYLLTFVGTTPPNQKEPQGEPYEPKAAPAEDAADSDSTSVAMNLNQ